MLGDIIVCSTYSVCVLGYTTVFAQRRWKSADAAFAYSCAQDYNAINGAAQERVALPLICIKAHVKELHEFFTDFNFLLLKNC